MLENIQNLFFELYQPKGWKFVQFSSTGKPEHFSIHGITLCEFHVCKGWETETFDFILIQELF